MSLKCDLNFDIYNHQFNDLRIFSLFVKKINVLEIKKCRCHMEQVP
jgi:hypothetical protein